MLIETIEEEVAELYREQPVTPSVRRELETTLLAEFDKAEAAQKREREALERRLSELRRQRAKLLEAHFADSVPLDLLPTEQDRIGRARADVERQLDAMQANMQKSGRNYGLPWT